MKISEKDFRIGNLIYYHIVDPEDERSEWDEIETIDHDDLRCFVQYEDNSEYRPIPLTEEWFFKLHSEDEIEKSKRFPNEITVYDRFLFIWKENYKYWYVMTAYHREYLTKIEFVHEYQNFIKTLDGIELTLN